MRYCGSKKKFANDIIPILLGAIDSEDTLFVDMCCGGCSIISEMPHKYKWGVDSNEYVIKLWNKLKTNVMNGYPGDNIPYDITEEQYKSIKQSYLNRDGRWEDYIIGYVGNACSYGGAWFNGFAKPNYNKRNGNGEPENHCHEAYNGLMKQLNGFHHIETTEFLCGSFDSFIYPEHSVIYADPPYFETKSYKDDFPHDRFWQWVRDMSNSGHKVFVSEYTAPSDFKCIWEKRKKDGMGTTKNGREQNIKVERLFVYDRNSNTKKN